MLKDDKSVISELMIEDEPCSGALLANKFNEHFLKAGVSTTRVDENSSYISYVTGNVASSVFFLFPTTESEIYTLLQK